MSKVDVGHNVRVRTQPDDGLPWRGNDTEVGWVVSRQADGMWLVRFRCDSENLFQFMESELVPVTLFLGPDGLREWRDEK